MYVISMQAPWKRYQSIGRFSHFLALRAIAVRWFMHPRSQSRLPGDVQPRAGLIPGPRGPLNLNVGGRAGKHAHGGSQTLVWVHRFLLLTVYCFHISTSCAPRVGGCTIVCVTVGDWVPSWIYSYLSSRHSFFSVGWTDWWRTGKLSTLVDVLTSTTHHRLFFKLIISWPSLLVERSYSLVL